MILNGMIRTWSRPRAFIFGSILNAWRPPVAIIFNVYIKLGTGSRPSFLIFRFRCEIKDDCCDRHFEFIIEFLFQTLTSYSTGHVVLTFWVSEYNKQVLLFSGQSELNSGRHGGHLQIMKCWYDTYTEILKLHRFYWYHKQGTTFSIQCR